MFTPLARVAQQAGYARSERPTAAAVAPGIHPTNSSHGKTALHNEAKERLLRSEVLVKADRNLALGVAGSGPGHTLLLAQHDFEAHRAGHAREAVHLEGQALVFGCLTRVRQARARLPPIVTRQKNLCDP